MAFPENWPKYYAKLLTLGSGESSVGIATLWTKKDLFVNKLDKREFFLQFRQYSQCHIVARQIRIPENKNFHILYSQALPNTLFKIFFLVFIQISAALCEEFFFHYF